MNGAPVTQRPSTTADRFSLASGSWVISAEEGSVVRPVFGDDPLPVARELMRSLRDAEERSGRSHVLCGLIPFDLAEPARLRLTSQVDFSPRDGVAPVLSTAGAGEGGLSAPDDSEYRVAVRRALRAIDDGIVGKVVLSRTVDFAPVEGMDVDALADALCERLAAANRRADVFRCPDGEGALWVGASPEVIADVRGGRFLTHPLAGSLPRTVPREEAVERLRASAKDLREHAFVVRHIGRALEPLAGELTVPEVPDLFATDAMWHLGTRIRGDLVPGVSALEAAVAIHPTPAVCGTPSGSAQALIRDLESGGREFYSGLVGWTDSSGDGRWSLVLRGAKLDPGMVRLQAGAGIVAGSDPDAEHAETGAKFRTMLRALEGLVHPF